MRSSATDTNTIGHRVKCFRCHNLCTPPFLGEVWDKVFAPFGFSFRIVMLQLRPFFFGLVLIAIAGCPGGEEGKQGNHGATASLVWDPVIDPLPISYTVHYGEESPRNAGSCNYKYSVNTSQPFATITDLESNATYYFAVSAFNGLHGICSNEVEVATGKPGQDTPQSQ